MTYDSNKHILSSILTSLPAITGASLAWQAQIFLKKSNVSLLNSR